MKDRKKTNISLVNKVVTHTQKTPTKMSREFVVIRADGDVVVLQTKPCDHRSRVNMSLPVSLCCTRLAAPPLAWIIWRICCCCEHLCAENLLLGMCEKVNSVANSPDFTSRLKMVPGLNPGLYILSMFASDFSQWCSSFLPQSQRHADWGQLNRRL